jgi:hypothetical protein
VSQAVFTLLEIFNRQMDKDSGVPEMERGAALSGGRTAFEINQITQQSKTPGAWSMRQAVAFHVRTIQRATLIGRDLDRAPILLPIKGIPVPFNVPGDPTSSIEPYLRQYSACLVSEQDLSRSDSRQAQAEELQMLNTVAPWVGRGVDPVWFITKLLEIGQYDVKQALQQPSAAPVAGGLPSPTGGGAPGVNPAQAAM